MNSTAFIPFRSLIAVAVAATLFVGCASVPKHPAGSEQVRAKLTALQSEPSLANGAPVALKDAEGAVVVAEMKEKDLVLAAHRVYIADRKVDTARAGATKANTVNAEIKRSTATLMEEMQRKTGDSK